MCPVPYVSTLNVTIKDESHENNHTKYKEQSKLYALKVPISFKMLFAFRIHCISQFYNLNNLIDVNGHITGINLYPSTENKIFSPSFVRFISVSVSWYYYIM